MKPSLLQLEQELKAKNINLSYQRLKVLQYLADKHSHPSVDNIFSDLHKEIPTLSKTTVYNTLRVLADAGLVKALAIEDNETRYDIDTSDHGHFKCQNCNAIYDFYIDIDKLSAGELKNFKINDKNVYFKGTCASCLLT